jgi:hypothetical protein
LLRSGWLCPHPARQPHREPPTGRTPQKSAPSRGRVERWRGGVGFGIVLCRGFPVCASIAACLTPFPPPAHRTRRADFPHRALRLASPASTRTLCFISGVTPKTSQSSLASKVLSVTAESLVELIGKANLRTVGLFQERAKSQAPFLRQSYPASSVVRACPPPQTTRPAPHGVPVESHDLSSKGLPVFRRFPLPCMPTPLPRRNRPMLSLSSRAATAFPKKETGRLPQFPFRGLLSVHSRFGLHGR